MLDQRILDDLAEAMDYDIITWNPEHDCYTYSVQLYNSPSHGQYVRTDMLVPTTREVLQLVLEQVKTVKYKCPRCNTTCEHAIGNYMPDGHIYFECSYCGTMNTYEQLIAHENRMTHSQ